MAITFDGAAFSGGITAFWIYEPPQPVTQQSIF